MAQGGGRLLHARQATTGSSHDPSVYEQAVLPDARGGVQLACADAVCESAFLAGVCACFVYVVEHVAHLHVPSDISADSPLPLCEHLRRAAHLLSAASEDAGSAPSLSSLLCASPPPSQRDLAQGVWECRRRALLDGAVDRAQRARVLSCGGPGAKLVPRCPAGYTFISRSLL